MLVQGVGGSSPAEDFSWPCVECVHDRLELLGTPARHVGPLREVLAQQSVGVLVCAALPRTVRIGELDR
jgi:hypothetical protein